MWGSVLGLRLAQAQRSSSQNVRRGHRPGPAAKEQKEPTGAGNLYPKLLLGGVRGCALHSGLLLGGARGCDLHPGLLPGG